MNPLISSLHHFESHPLYAAHRIPEVWVINVRKRCIEVYLTPKPEAHRYGFSERIERATLSAESIAEVKLALGELFPSASQ